MAHERPRAPLERASTPSARSASRQAPLRRAGRHAARELLAIGEANLEKDYAAFVETAKKIDPSKTPAEVMKSLSNDHPTADDLIPSVQRTIEAARQYLVDKKIVTIPSECGRRSRRRRSTRGGSFASMDTPGPFETKATEAFYYITPAEKDWDAKHKEEHLRLFNPRDGDHQRPRGLPRALPPVPLRHAIPDQDAQAGLVRHQRRGLGPLLRADDGRRGLRRRRPRRSAWPSSRRPCSATAATSSASSCTPRA